MIFQRLSLDDLIVPKLIDALRPLLSEPDRERVFFAGEQVPVKKKSEPAFAFTEWGAYWFEVGKRSAKLVQIGRWIELEGVKIDEQITFDFQDRYTKSKPVAVTGTFRSPAAPRVFQFVKQFIESFISAEDLPKFRRGVHKATNSPNKAFYDPILRYRVLHRRFMESLPDDTKRRKKLGLYPSDASLRIVSEFLKSRNPKFPLLLVPDDADSLLRCVRFMTHVDTVSIPGTGKLNDAKTIITAWMAQQVHIKRIEFTDGAHKLRDYVGIFQERTAKQQNPFECLIFTDVPLTAANLHDIAALVDRQVTKLTFSNSVAAELTGQFVELLSRDTFAILTHLNITRCPGLDARPILATIPGLRVLCLIACGLDVASVLEALTKHTRLLALNLSENVARLPIGAGQPFAPAVRDFSADRVAWSGESLQQCWAAAVRRAEPVTLSFGSAGLSSDQWQAFFAACAGLASPGLGGLLWVRNRVDARLFACLGQCPRLAVLNVSGAVRPGDPALPALAEFLCATQSLAEFTLCAADDATALTLDDLTVVLHAVAANRSIEKITVAEHMVGPGLLPVLAEALMNNRRVGSIRFDGNAFTDFAALFAVFETWKDRGRPLKIPWPEEDLVTICTADSAVHQRIPKLKALWDVVCAGNLSIDVPKELYELKPQPQLEKAAPPVTVEFAPPPPPPPAPPPPPSVSQPSAYATPKQKTRCGPIVFEDVEVIEPPDASEFPLPLPPLPPLENMAVVDQFDRQFPLETILAQLQQI